MILGKCASTLSEWWFRNYLHDFSYPHPNFFLAELLVSCTFRVVPTLFSVAIFGPILGPSYSECFWVVRARA